MHCHIILEVGSEGLLSPSDSQLVMFEDRFSQIEEVQSVCVFFLFMFLLLIYTPDRET